MGMEADKTPIGAWKVEELVALQGGGGRGIFFGGWERGGKI